MHKNTSDSSSLIIMQVSVTVLKLVLSLCICKGNGSTRTKLKSHCLAVHHYFWTVNLHIYIGAMTLDFQQCGILTSVDSDEPVQPPCKPRLQIMFGQ